MVMRGAVANDGLALGNRWVDGVWNPKADGPIEGHGGIDRAERFIELRRYLDARRTTNGDRMRASPSAKNELVTSMSKAMPDNIPVSPPNFSKCLDMAAQNKSAGK